MTTSSGFIVINSEGLYAREYESLTHDGNQNRIEWVSDINRATVFINRAYATLRHKEISGCVMLAASLTHQVRITGAEA